MHEYMLTTGPMENDPTGLLAEVDNMRERVALAGAAENNTFRNNGVRES